MNVEFWATFAVISIAGFTGSRAPVASRRGKHRSHLARVLPPSVFRYFRETHVASPSIVAAVHALKNIDHDHVCVFDCRDRDDVDVFDGGAITGVNPYAVDINGSCRRHQVSKPRFAKCIFDRFAEL
jgi:hypothetical protein